MAAIKTREIHYTAPDGSALIGYFAGVGCIYLEKVILA